MTIATWNVNSLKARAAHVARFLEARAPDALLLQEVKGETLAAEFPGYESAATLQKAYNGVAVLARVPFTVVRARLDADDPQARYLEVALSTGERLINIYAPNGNPVGSEKFTYKLAWLKRLYHRVQHLREARVPFLIAGDFNIIPQDADCYDPRAWVGDALFQPESRAAYRALLHLGLTDALRARTPGGPGPYTFWSYRGGAWGANKGIRIDHALLAPALADRLVSCEVDAGPRGWDTPSDHTPLIVEIET
ncbi:MAG: exodeoxyribonuclease III [Alphaproteobacteria bacterium]|nr:exodeoxyribonuclease III [Alphaproteobacteria bacterium]